MKRHDEICEGCERLNYTPFGETSCDFFWTGDLDIDPATGRTLIGTGDVPKECLRWLEYTVLNQSLDEIPTSERD